MRFHAPKSKKIFGRNTVVVGNLIDQLFVRVVKFTSLGDFLFSNDAFGIVIKSEFELRLVAILGHNLVIIG